MILLTALHDEYIDRQKMTEQKNPVEYIVPPPLKWAGTIKLRENECNCFRRQFVKYFIKYDFLISSVFIKLN